MTRLTNTYYHTGYEQGKCDLRKLVEEAIDEIKQRASEKKAIPEYCGMMESVEIIRKYVR